MDWDLGFRVPVLAGYRFFSVINMYNSWICINAYLNSVSISIIGPICDWPVCIRFNPYLTHIQININIFPYHIHNEYLFWVSYGFLIIMDAMNDIWISNDGW